MKIIGVDISLIFSMTWEANEGKEFSAAFRRTVDIVTNARAGFDRCMLAIDSGASFRKACPEYKANRSDRGEPYREQLKRTIDRLVADGCTPIVAPAIGTFAATGATSYAEADDVMGWAVEEYSKLVAHLSEEAMADWSFAIRSDDSDMEQLVDDAACVFVIKSELRGVAHWTEATVMEKRGVTPDNVIDAKALTGDKSDNFDGYKGPEKPRDPANPDVDPGCNPGVGPVHAASLIKKYGGALAIFDVGATPDERAVRWEADGVKPNIRATLERHGRGVAEKGIFLATIRRELPGLDFAAVMAEPVVKSIAPPIEFKEDPKVTPLPRPASKAPESPASSASMVVSHPSSLLDPSQADWALSLQPRSTLEAMELAKHLYDSRLFTKFGNAQAIFAIIMVGRERGISTMIALTSIDMIDGKPSLSADLIAAQVIRSGKAKKFTCIETTDERGVYLVQRHDDPEPMRVEFTKQHAMARGLWGKGNWLKMPDVMLVHRCASKAARLKFPDVTVGLYGEGEIHEARHAGVLDAEFESSAA